MNLQKTLSLNAKLQAVSEDKRAHLISYLPETIRKELESPQFPKNSIPVPMTTHKIVKRVDVTHFIHYLEKLPAKEKAFYIAAFPEYKQVVLTGPNVEYKEYRTQAFSNTILNILFKKALSDFPPPGVIPIHPTVELLADKNIPLSKLITFLGLIDVAAEVKGIISRSTLKNLQEAFDGEEVAFMNQAGRQKSILSLSVMNLACYKGDCEMLRNLIKERGIYRFAQGIKDAPAEYHFYFTYFLPKQISDKINTLLKKRPHLSPSYKKWEEDIITTWRFICTYSP